MLRIFVALAVLLCPGGALAGSWELVAQGEGVRCYLRKNPETGLPVVRAVTRVDAPLVEVLALIADVDGSCTWAGRCLEARIIRRHGLTRFRMYTLRQGPPLVSNRDVELDVSIEIERGGELVRVSFHDTRQGTIAVPKGAVRMPLMRGHYLLRALGPGSTEVELLIEGDPGGLIPRWVLPWAAKAIPFDSLKALRSWAPRLRGQHPDLVRSFEALVQPWLQRPQRQPRAGSSGAKLEPLRRKAVNVRRPLSPLRRRARSWRTARDRFVRFVQSG